MNLQQFSQAGFDNLSQLIEQSSTQRADLGHTTRHLNPDESQSLDGSAIIPKAAALDSHIEVETTSSMPCRANCKCQCHRYTRLSSPAILSGILGRLFLNYHTILSCNLLPCNSAACANNEARTIRLTYLFPTWLLARMVSIQFHLDSWREHGASIHLNVPHVLDESHDVWAAIRCNNITRLQHLITQKKISPMDVDKLGQSLLLVCRVPCLVNLPLIEMAVRA